MLHEPRTEPRNALDIQWFLAGGLVVVLTGYTFFLFTLAFIADLGDVHFIADVTKFVLILSVAVFGALLLAVANATTADSAEIEEALDSGTAYMTTIESPVSCPGCGLIAPFGAKFCGHCGSGLGIELHQAQTLPDDAEDIQPT